MAIEIHIEIESECILNCKHCSSDLNSEMGLNMGKVNKIVSFIKSIKNADKIYICLTGGEPLNSKNFFYILEKLNEIDNIHKIGFFTSGCILKKKMSYIDNITAQKLKNRGVSFVYVSLYSNLEERHDSITMMKGSFNRTIKSIRNLISAGITTNINYVLMKDNYSNLGDVINFLVPLCVNELRVLKLVKHGRAVKNWDNIGIDIDIQRKIVEKLLNDTNNIKNGLKITVAGFPELKDCRPFELGKYCQAGIRLFYIDINGNVYPCACKKKDESYLILNVYESDIFNNMNFIKVNFRKRCLQIEKGGNGDNH